MEKDVICDIYMTLNKNLNSVKKEAIEEAVANREDAGEIIFSNATLDCDEIYFDTDTKCIMASGNLEAYGKHIGYLSPQIKLGNDTILEIINFYIKKMQKVKTMLEAIKD